MLRNSRSNSFSAYRRDSFTEDEAMLPEIKLPDIHALRPPGSQPSPILRKGGPQESLSEIELHLVKTAFNRIEDVWRDISMGADFISSSMMASIHGHLGEIGSELFGAIFINSTVSKQVLCYFSSMY
jgi:hypothetical protein